MHATTFKNRAGSDAGFSTMEIIIFLSISLLLVAVTVGLYYVLAGNSNERVAERAGIEAHMAVQSYYADRAAMPADASDIDAYMDAEGDTSIDTNLPPDSVIGVYADSGARAPATITVVRSNEFTDVLVIDRMGGIERIPSATYTAPTEPLIASWTVGAPPSL